MSVASVKARLITIAGTIAGINDAIRTPRDIPQANLPAALVLAGDSDVPLNTSSLMDDIRIYRIIVLVMPWAEGIEFEAEQRVEPFFNLFRQEFSDNASLDTGNNDPLTGVQNSQYIGSTGVIDVVLAGVKYAGVEFRLQVWEQYNVCKR